MMEFWRKLLAFWHRRALERELHEEIQSHLEMKKADTPKPGDIAHQFGNPALVFEDTRAVWGWPATEAWWRDFRYGIRMMIRRPRVAITIVLILTIGIGSASTILSLVDTVVIRPLPYPQADRLVALFEARSSTEQTDSRVAPGRLEDWNRLTRTFDGIAGSYVETFTETSGAVAEQLSGAYVSARFFDVLGTPPQAGRVFYPNEELSGGPMVVVISDSLWRRRFNADASIAGRTLSLSGQTYTILGVMPASFQYPSPRTELWAPKQARPALLQIRVARFYESIGRLKPGVPLSQALADLKAVQRKLGEQYPKTDSGWSVSAYPLKDRIVGNSRLGLWLLMGSALVLLLITCTNVACLLLVQSNSRAEEMATRRAIGASRGAIARQLLVEGLVYAAAGGLGGTALAFVSASLVKRALTDLPRISEFGIDLPLLAFATAVSILSAGLFSLAPILHTFSSASRGSLLRSGRGVISSNQLLSRVFAAAQFALAAVLLIGSGLFIRTLLKLQDTELGFSSAQVITFRVSASFNETADAVVQRHQRVMDTVSALPGVRSVGMSTGAPGTLAGTPLEFRLPAQTSPSGSEDLYAAQKVVTAGYFQTLGIPVLRGETCRMDPDPRRGFEAVVNSSFIRRFLQGREPIGHTISLGPPDNSRPMQIVGVVADSRESGYARAPEPLIYSCGFLRFWPDSMFLVNTADTASTANAIRSAVNSVEPSRAVYASEPLPNILSGTLSQNRFRAWLVTMFSAVALILAAVGLYGVTAYAVSQRTKELSIRMALGARGSQIWAETLSSGASIACAGLGIGLLLSWIATRLIRSLLYSVGPFDPVTYLYAIAILVIVAMLACIPAGRRAASIDPARALREG